MNQNSVLLEQVKHFILSKFTLRETLAILLVGSYATGRSRKYSDIDIIIFNKSQIIPVERREVRFQGYNLDIWFYSQSYFEETFQKEATTPNHLGEISLFLGFLREAIIWYQKGIFLDKFIASSQNWEWNPEYYVLLNFPSEKPRCKWAINAFEEHLILVKAAKKRLKENNPISHRLKDYPELISDFKENTARRLMDLTSEVYSELGIGREWTEYKDAKKAIMYREWGLVVASLKDVLKFLIRFVLESSPDQLLDPMIWCSAEAGDLPVNLKKALEFIYSK
ncbi:MAG: nucleotidyltransferase domain-containing protein [Candidatus Hodarchaeales archaeon]|jgi:predicted nucleotidyltransferase